MFERNISITTTRSRLQTSMDTSLCCCVRSFHIIQESNVYTGYFNNDKTRPIPDYTGGYAFMSYGQGPFPGAGRFFFANTTQNEQTPKWESFTLDGAGGGYFGSLDAVDGATLTLSGDACWSYIGGYNQANCSIMTEDDNDGLSGHGAIGKAVQVVTGPGKGQWRRIVSVGGARNRTITLDFPFDPPPAAALSSLQIGPMRGQIMVVGNDFVYGGAMQFYAACLDCVVAENIFRSFGFVNWGRNPSAIGESNPIQLSTE